MLDLGLGLFAFSFCCWVGMDAFCFLVFFLVGCLMFLGLADGPDFSSVSYRPMLSHGG